MIIEKIIYEVGNKRFDSYDEAVEYESLCDEVTTIMSALQECTPEVANGEAYITHDIVVVKETFKKIIKLWDKTLNGKYTDRLNALIEKGISYGSAGDCIIGDYSNEYPCLYDAYFRFKCINFKSGREFSQPYYAKHEDEFFAYK